MQINSWSMAGAWFPDATKKPQGWEYLMFKMNCFRMTVLTITFLTIKKKMHVAEAFFQFILYFFDDNLADSTGT